MKFKYENIVLGGSFDAVYLAFREGWPIIYKELEKPFEKDLIGSRNKKDFYEFMVFLLSMSNLNPFSFKVADIRMERRQNHSFWS